MSLPVHDHSVRDVDVLDVMVVVFRIGEQIQAVARPVIIDLEQAAKSRRLKELVYNPNLSSSQ